MAMPDPDRKFSVEEAFAGTRLWIFDLDNTLYPAECNLFAQIDHQRLHGSGGGLILLAARIQF